MKRRELLLGLGGLCAGGLGACTPPLSFRERTTADVQLHLTPRGPSLRSDFLGLSFESSQLADPDIFNAGDTELVALMRRLSPNGVLRIGGDSSDFGVWQRQPTALAAPFQFAIAPADIDRLAGFVEACGWSLIYGLNLGHGEPERAADEAAYVVERLGARLAALQIGNEPDLYYRNGLRPRNYDIDAFITEWGRYAHSIRARVPAAPLAGPDVAYRPEWIAQFIQAKGGEVGFISDHYDAAGPPNDPTVGIGTLFGSESKHYAQLRGVAERTQALGRRLLISEASSVYNGGKAGVGDTLGAALWATQLLFQLSRDGLAGVCFHNNAGRDAAGANAVLSRDARTGTWTPRPLYYALLLFAQAAPATSIDAQTHTGSGALRAHALIGDDGRLKLVLINENPLYWVDARIVADRALSFGSALVLAGSSIWRTSGITLGGSRVESSGRWQPQPEAVAIDGGAAYVTVSPACAMLISFD